MGSTIVLSLISSYLSDKAFSLLTKEVVSIFSSSDHHVFFCGLTFRVPSYRWVPLKLDFLGAWKSVWLKHYLSYPIIIISLIKQRNLATKIWAKWESGLTTVWIKRDPPVLEILAISLFFCMQSYIIFMFSQYFTLSHSWWGTQFF